MKSSKIAVILPSRGQLFSQTLEELLTNLEGFDYQIFWSHDKPIPQCFNKPLERALKDLTFTHFWFVEEDMVLPPNTLKSLMSHNDSDLVACDYPVTKSGQSSITYDPDGRAFFSGTGCLLVARGYLENCKKPVFRSDIAWDIREGKVLELTPRLADKGVYGFHDITFGVTAYLKGSPIEVSPVKCGQRRLVERGADGTNDGAHQIEEWLKVEPHSLFKAQGEIQPESGNIRLNDGSIGMVSAERAAYLISQGLAKPEIRGYRYLSVVNNELTEQLI